MSEFIDTVFYGFDTSVFTLVGGIQNSVFNYVSVFVSLFGTTEAFIVYCLIAILLCCFKKTRKYGIPMAVALAVGSFITNLTLKPLVNRPRPYIGLLETEFWDTYEGFYVFAGSRLGSDESFPSGHTTLAFEVAVSIGLAAWKDNKKWLTCVLFVFASCVALSRIYLMVHYPSDVLFGFIIGVFAGVIGFLCREIIYGKDNRNLMS